MPRKKLDPVPNGLRYMRLRRGMSINTLSEVSGIPTTTIYRLETGQPISKEYLLTLSAALKCNPREISAPRKEIPTVPIIGLIKNKSAVTLLPKSRWGQAVRLEGMGEGTQAVRVVGDAVRTHHGRNTLLYFHEKPEKNPARLEGEYLVELTNEKLLLCQAAPGSKKGLHSLYPYAAMAPMFEQQVAKAYPILHVVRSQS